MDKLDLIKAFPKTPDVVNDRIAMEVNKHLHGRRRKTSVKKVFIVSLAAVMLLGTTVFAATMRYRIRLEKNGYEADILVEMDDDKKIQSANVTTILDGDTVVIKGGAPAEVEEFVGYDNVAIRLNYLPEGVKYEDKDGKYRDGKEGLFNITVIPYKLNITGVISNEKNVIDVEEFKFEGKFGYILTHHNVNEESGIKTCYLFFDNSNYYVFFHMASDIADEDIKLVLENCVLEGVEEETLPDCMVFNKNADNLTYDQIMEREYVYTNVPQESQISQISKTEHEIGEVYYVENGKAFEKFAGVGETIITPTEEFTELTGNKFHFTLNSVAVVDNIGEYDKQFFMEDLPDDIFDGEGNVLPLEVNVVKQGDGINTLNEVIGERSISRKAVVVNLTVECVSVGEEWEEHISNTPRLIYDVNRMIEGGYEANKNGDYFEDYYPVYNDKCVNVSRQFYHAKGKTGDVFDCTLIYIVNEDMLGHMGLDFDNTSGTNPNEAFDIRQVQ